MAAAPSSSGFGVPVKSTRTKSSGSKTGRSHGTVPKKSWHAPTAKKVASSLPPLAYNRGPITFQIGQYVWRLTAIRGDEKNKVVMTEIETVTWDDSSAVLTGSLTFVSPDWTTKLGLREGHEILCEWSEMDGAGWTPLWRMRVDAPNSDLGARTRTANLVNDLNRLMQSDDNFVYAKGKKKPKGWRVDEIIRDICKRYGLVVASCPKMTTYITNWHLTDQKPLDVIHSALVREKNNTGRKYAVSLDAKKRVHISAFKRPTSLLEIGPQLISATGSATHDPRFATKLTVRAAAVTKTTTDKKGHRKVRQQKISADVSSPAGTKLYGIIHRNVYSPDAQSNSAARKEGKLFLAAVAKPTRQFTVTLPGMPSVTRLDAFRVRLPTEGISQIVYVSDARHTLDGGSGYTVEATLDFDDPFVDNKATKILNKLADAAVARKRKVPAAKTNTGKKTKTGNAHSTKTSGFGVPVDATKTAKHPIPKGTK